MITAHTSTSLPELDSQSNIQAASRNHYSDGQPTDEGMYLCIFLEGLPVGYETHSLGSLGTMVWSGALSQPIHYIEGGAWIPPVHHVHGKQPRDTSSEMQNLNGDDLSRPSLFGIIHNLPHSWHA